MCNESTKLAFPPPILLAQNDPYRELMFKMAQKGPGTILFFPNPSLDFIANSTRVPVFIAIACLRPFECWCQETPNFQSSTLELFSQSFAAVSELIFFKFREAS